MAIRFILAEDKVMIIRALAQSVYYPVSGQRAGLVRGGRRVRYVRGSLVVNPKS
jgi:hypothetical protein